MAVSLDCVAKDRRVKRGAEVGDGVSRTARLGVDTDVPVAAPQVGTVILAASGTELSGCRCGAREGKSKSKNGGSHLFVT
jgi:hypothetical protein